MDPPTWLGLGLPVFRRRIGDLKISREIVDHLGAVLNAEKSTAPLSFRDQGKDLLFLEDPSFDRRFHTGARGRILQEGSAVVLKGYVHWIEIGVVVLMGFLLYRQFHRVVYREVHQISATLLLLFFVVLVGFQSKLRVKRYRQVARALESSRSSRVLKGASV